MSETQGQGPNATQDQGPGADPPELEQLPVTRGEKVAAVVALAVLAALALVCIDLATGGKLSSRFGTVPAASRLPEDAGDGEAPCADC